MDEERKRQLVNLLRNPVFDIDTSDNVELHRYDQALTHSTYANQRRGPDNPCEDNERLEFFGDCILDFLIGRELYESFSELIDELRRQYPGKKDEALLTDMLHDITNNKQLSEIARSIDSFDAAILCGKGQKVNDKIRAGAFEAFIAAIFEDQKIEKTRTIVAGLFKDKIKSAEPIVSWKNKLQECVQELKRGAKVDEIIHYEPTRKEGTPDHDARHKVDVYVKTEEKWELWGTGEGKQKKDAEVEAAKNAYETHCGQR